MKAVDIAAQVECEFAFSQLYYKQNDSCDKWYHFLLNVPMH